MRRMTGWVLMVLAVLLFGWSCRVQVRSIADIGFTIASIVCLSVAESIVYRAGQANPLSLAASEEE